MLLTFFRTLRDFEVPVSTVELLDCLGMLKAGLVQMNLDDFYYLSRTCLVKDEKFYDRFDRAFSFFFSGLGDQPLPLDETQWQQMFNDLAVFQLPDPVLRQELKR